MEPYEIKKYATRCERAPVGNQELSRLVFEACGGSWSARYSGERWFLNGVLFAATIRDFTQSVDSALSLLEEVLPSWEFKLEQHRVEIWNSPAPANERLTRVSVSAASVPLGICAALLKVVAEKASVQLKSPQGDEAAQTAETPA
jgi:hypothetical protein